MESIRSALQPVTQNLPKPIVETGHSLLGPFCYKTLILDIDPFASPDCVKLAVSKGLGIGIIAASSIVKIPQLLKILNAQSAEGVSFLSYLLESGSYLISLGYNTRHGFPFSTYGEQALIMVQNAVIASLVLKYSGKGAAGVGAWVAGLVAVGTALFREDLVDIKMLSWLMSGAGVLSVASKVPQILTIWKEGGTGQLSAFAVINYLIGSLSRIFTTLQEVPDPLILYGFIAAFTLNAILAFQMMWYWNSSTSKKTESKKLNKPIAAQKGKKGTPANPATTGESYAQVAAKSPSTRRRG
ncbi:mannose-P-dolichol utilization defect 1 protein [Trematosphaeria pertusa]|uniref:Mannose-P-dolichol utilization defect 1 protein homolog n=1 Tax=Trematosphaeria pertusa TaxID=390896 RepID=A0A6A6IWX1_9PLEO|nr:mannose-P-dolichol utilization defect 1 protein [Trematosphaeria pertusa]KAF2255041.1 mannose-P-dolichol utilization defect 1 protein [Trematosphaeria pertusa]